MRSWLRHKGPGALSPSRDAAGGHRHQQLHPGKRNARGSEGTFLDGAGPEWSPHGCSPTRRTSITPEDDGSRNGVVVRHEAHGPLVTGSVP